jgi:hypothetical protein
MGRVVTIKRLLSADKLYPDSLLFPKYLYGIVVKKPTLFQTWGSICHNQNREVYQSG